MQHRILPGGPLPSAYGNIDIERVNLNAVCSASDLLGCHDRAARPRKTIEDNGAATRAIFYGISNQGRRLYGRVLDLVSTAAAEGVRHPVSPYISPAPVAPS